MEPQVGHFELGSPSDSNKDDNLARCFVSLTVEQGERMTLVEGFTERLLSDVL